MAKDTKDKAESPPRVSVYYEKSAQYRTVHADGIWVALTPAAKVQFSILNELTPLPEFILHELTNGNLGTQLEQVKKDGMVRENEVTVVMDIPLVIQFIALLQQMVTQVQAHQAQVNQQQARIKKG